MPTQEENNNTPVVRRYYPVLSDIVSLEDIPEIFQAVVGVFTDHTIFTDFQQSSFC